MTTDDEPTTSALRWSHCTNWLGSHGAQPGPERWNDHETALETAVCMECGYLATLTPDWERWRS